MDSKNNSYSILNNIRILEMESIGPVPWGVGLLADFGAQVTRVKKPSTKYTPENLPKDSLTNKGRIDITLDLKEQQDKKEFLSLLHDHDVLIEGMRPGVMEKLGLGPIECKKYNNKLIYVRMTGWGQSGYLADKAGHDINYISLSGALHSIGKKNDSPCIPLNIVGDYGGGGNMLVISTLLGIYNAKINGKGLIVDASMLDGAVKQMAMIYERFALDQWIDKRESNRLDGGAPWYTTYKTKCNGYMAVGALENKFYMNFIQGLGLNISTLPSRDDRKNWDVLRQIFTSQFKLYTRAEWTKIFEQIDACVTPVLSLSEAPEHPFNQQRSTFTKKADKHTYKPSISPRITTL